MCVCVCLCVVFCVDSRKGDESVCYPTFQRGTKRNSDDGDDDDSGDVIVEL